MVGKKPAELVCFAGFSGVFCFVVQPPSACLTLSKNDLPDPIPVAFDSGSSSASINNNSR
jgi:hypothetical protein